MKQIRIHIDHMSIRISYRVPKIEVKEHVFD